MLQVKQMKTTLKQTAECKTILFEALSKKCFNIS